MPQQTELIIDCPYCGEAIDVLIDESAGEQQYYEDCQVCCAPILFCLSEDIMGVIQMTVKRFDD